MKNPMRRKVLASGIAALAASAAIAAPAAAHAADDAASFPDRAVRIVVPFPPGGSTDITARLVAAQLTQQWKQPVTVENKPGAGASIGTEMVAHAAPDGYTILLGTTAFPISAATFAKLPYDPRKDLLPVMLVSTIANVLVVNPKMPAKTIQEFVAYARSHPGKLNYASPGAATGQRLTFELLKQATGIDIVHVPYKGGAPAGQAVLGGEVESMMMNVVEATPQLKAGRLRALAVTTAERAPQVPDVPTLDETVAPGIDTSVWQGVLVPAGTPAPVLQKINRGWRDALAAPDVRGRLEEMGMHLVAGSPGQFDKFLDAEFVQWKEVARKGNIKVE
jgi:tripartite-type tricarboxylate transporter receptor subunit TctC